MKRAVACVMILAMLASCGADGEPIKPSAKKPGISVTGEVSAGVVAGG